MSSVIGKFEDVLYKINLFLKIVCVPLNRDFMKHNEFNYLKKVL